MTAPSVLVVGPSWVGDMIMADVAFQWLVKRGFDVDVLAPAWSLPVLERMDSVRNAIALEVGHGELGLATRRAVARKLRAREYEQAIVLPRSLKASLVPYFARIPQRTGFRGEMRYGLINDCRAFDKESLNQTVKRFLFLALAANESLPASYSMPALRVDTQTQQQALNKYALGHRALSVALMPGAEYGPAKCWPIERFQAVASELDKSEVEVRIFGSAKDKDAGDAICQGNNAINLCGQTSLQEAVDLLAACDVAVSNDSGLMHMAAAVGCHVVALYGSTTPKFTPPLTSAATLIERDLPCRPCFERVCPLEHFNCMREISVRDVLTQIQPLLAPRH